MLFFTVSVGLMIHICEMDDRGYCHFSKEMSIYPYKLNRIHANFSFDVSFISVSSGKMRKNASTRHCIDPIGKPFHHKQQQIVVEHSLCLWHTLSFFFFLILLCVSLSIYIPLLDNTFCLELSQFFCTQKYNPLFVWVWFSTHIFAFVEMQTSHTS